MTAKITVSAESMRIDIPKDNVLPSAHREAGRKYRVTGFFDPDPPTRLYNELVGKGRK